MTRAKSVFPIGTKVKWNSNVKGIISTIDGVVVRYLHGDDISGPRRLAAQFYPNHKRMFTAWGIPGKAKVGYLIEVGNNEIHMPNPATVQAVNILSEDEIDNILHKGSYKTRQRVMDRHVVNIHSGLTRKSGQIFKMTDGTKYMFDRNGCIRKTDNLV